MKITTILILILSLVLIYYKLLIDNQADQFQNSNFDNIDIVYFINLDHRLDRLYDFLNEMKRINFPFNKIVRISGVYKAKQGHLGCSLSHIKALENFIASDYNNCIIFEDDFQFTKSSEEVNQAFSDLFNNNVNFDVCMLAGYIVSDVKSDYPFLKKITRATTTSGYIVNQHFAQTLLKNFKKGAGLLQRMFNGEIPDDDYCIDQYWKHIQPNSNWYAFEPMLGTQRPSHSDTMN